MESFSRHDHCTWDQALQMLPHVDSLRASLQTENVSDEDKVACADLVCQYGHVAMWASCDYVTARESYEAALTNLKEVNGFDYPTHVRIATTIKDLGRLHQALGNYAAARAMYDDALRMMRAENPNAKSPTLATTLHNLGRVCLCLGERLQAAMHFKTALQMKREVNASQASIALTIANIGRLHQAFGRNVEALEQYQQIKNLEGFNLRNVFGGTVDLCEGQVYQCVGDLTNARLRYEQALEVYDQVFQAKNDAIAIAHRCLGSVLVDLSDLNGAYFHLEIALRMTNQVSDNAVEHDSIASVTYNMRRLYEKRDGKETPALNYTGAQNALADLIGEGPHVTSSVNYNKRNTSGMIDEAVNLMSIDNDPNQMQR